MRRLAFALLFAAPLGAVQADEIDNLDALSQPQFRTLTTDLASIAGYRALQPAEPAGIIGFDAGFDVAVAQIGNEAVWESAGADETSISVLRASINKGLPLNFDIGGFVAAMPGTGMRSYGAQLRYALVEGGVLMPAIGLRAAMTRLDGIDDLDYDTRSLDISVSKGFGPLTPYAGYGRVWAQADPHDGAGLASEDVTADRAFAGVRMSFVVLQLVLEAEQVEDTRSYAVRLAIGF